MTPLLVLLIAQDPLSAEIERIAGLVKTETSSSAIWTDLKGVSAAPLAAAEQAVKDGRRFLALQNLARARMNVLAGKYVLAHPAERKSQAAFEAEWTKNGAAIRSAPNDVASLKPLVVRAIAELVRSQAPSFYDASLEFARNTSAESGLHYVGAARAQLDLLALCRTVASAAPDEPQVRSIAAEIEKLRGELLALYRPPASIDRHAEMIMVSALLNEARELDAAGSHAAALLRYLQAAQRIVPLKRKVKPLAARTLAAKLDALEAKLADPKSDHSVGVLFAQTARSEAPDVATAIVTDVLPRYFAAIAPAPETKPAKEPEVTVTLVRWPFT